MSQLRHLNLEHFYLTPGAARMISNLLRRSGFIGVLAAILKSRNFYAFLTSKQTLGIWGVSKPSKPGSVRHLPQSHSDCHFRALSSKVNLWDVRPVNFLNLKSAMVRRQPFWRRGQRPAPEAPCYFLATTFPYFSNFGTYSLRTSQGESI